MKPARFEFNLEEEINKLKLTPANPANPEAPISEISNYESSTSNVPIPVFVPAVWTTASDSNWPVTLTYLDTQGNAHSFVFTQDYTIRPCWLCQIKNWFKYRVLRKGMKSSKKETK